MSIADVPIEEYVRRCGLEHQFVLQDLGDGAQIGSLMLPKAWIYTPLWAPITTHATTIEDFFRIYAEDKHDLLYTPATMEFLRELMSAGVSPANQQLAFAFGGDSNYWHLLKDFAPRLHLYLQGPELPLLVSPKFGEAQSAILHQIFLWLGRPVPPIVALTDAFAAVGPTIFPSCLSIAAAARIWETTLKPPPLAGEHPQHLFVMREGVRRRLLN